MVSRTTLRLVPCSQQARCYNTAITTTARAAGCSSSSSNLLAQGSRVTTSPLRIPQPPCRPRYRQQARLLHATTSISARQRQQIGRTRTAFSSSSIAKAISSSSRHASTSTSSSPSKPIGPKAIYADRVSRGELREDPRQLIILEDLQRLYDEVVAYKPPEVPEPLDTSATSSSSSSSSFVSPDEEATSTTFASLLGTLFGTRKNKSIPVPPIPEDVPKSLYLYGDVGCGKSMLMDLLYESLPESLGKRRVHFHAFMIDVHKKLHRIAADAESTGISQKGDAIVPVARELAKDGRVLCFDEFQVTDIADAMILRRLMESMIGYGFVIIITSNRAPDDLYKNGIQRASFIPCINLIKERFEVQDLDSDIDYRKLPRALSKVFYDPISPENRLEFHKVFEGFTGGRPIVRDRVLEVWGRKLRVPQSSSEPPPSSSSSSPSKGGKAAAAAAAAAESRASVAHFTFDELCGHALSAADYLEIVRHFDTVFISDVPQLTLSDKDKARRFITFIDAAYDNKTRLLTLSSVPITQVFSDAPEAKNPDEGYSAHQRAMMDDLGLDAGTIGASSIFTGDEEVFAFARAVSRLTEMGTRHWAERAGARSV